MFQKSSPPPLKQCGIFSLLLSLLREILQMCWLFISTVFVISGILLLLCCVEMCNKCFAERLQAEYLAQTFYENATIYISKVDEVDRTIAHGVESSSAAVTGLSASSTSFSSTLTPEDYINVTDEQVLLMTLY